jgi:putative acetyltransferase
MTADVEVALRPERAADRSAIRHVVGLAFGAHDVVPDLVDTLRDSASWIDGLSFVADVGGSLVGHVLLTRGWVDAPERVVDVLVLSPLAVLPVMQGQGVGGALVRHALAAAESRGEPAVFLEGSPVYYSRFGFTAGAALGFQRPSPRIPGPAFQVVTTSAYQPWMTGALVYSDVFWRLDCVGLRGERLSAALSAPAPRPDRHIDDVLTGEVPLDDRA